MVIAAHAICVRTITPFSLNSLEFPTFIKQDSEMKTRTNQMKIKHRYISIL